MVKKMITAALTITAGILAGVLLAIAGHSTSAIAAPMSSSVNVLPEPRYSSGSEITDNSSSSQPVSGYYIKEYKGRVAVVRAGNDTPEMIFDIHTKMLPDLDRKQLSDGIYVESYEEMLRLVEDYIS